MNESVWENYGKCNFMGALDAGLMCVNERLIWVFKLSLSQAPFLSVFAEISSTLLSSYYPVIMY